MELTPTVVLEHARFLITHPEHWTQGAYARDKNGLWVFSWAPEAHCLCSLGALRAAAGHLSDAFVADFEVYEEAALLQEAAKQLGYGGPTDTAHFNDNHTHAEVLAMFDKAIELSKEASRG